MYSKYVKEEKIVEKDEKEQDRELIDSINYVKSKLQGMHNNLQFAENDLVDYYVYSIKAEEAKYNYLLKLAKKNKLKQ